MNVNVVLFFICFLGLPIGTYIAFKSKEELPTGKKYFKICLPVFYVFPYFLLCYSLLEMYSITITLAGLLFSSISYVLTIKYNKRFMHFTHTPVIYLIIIYGLRPMLLLSTFISFLVIAGLLYQVSKSLSKNLLISLKTGILFLVVGWLLSIIMETKILSLLLPSL